MELTVKLLRRFDLPSADLDHAMIRVGDSAQMVVVAEWSDHRWVAVASPCLCSWKVLSAWCGWPSSPCVSYSPVLCLGLLGCPWKHCVRSHYSGLLPQSVYQVYSVLWTERWGALRLPNVGVVGVVVTRDVVDGAAQFFFGGFVLGVNEHWADGIAGLVKQVYSVRLVGLWQLLRWALYIRES